MSLEENLIAIAYKEQQAIELNKRLGQTLTKEDATLNVNVDNLEQINSELEQILYGTDTGNQSYHKIIPKTVSGTKYISVDDVSEILHNVEIEVSSDCGISVCGKNLCPNDWEAGYISDSTGLNQGGTYIRTKGYFTFDKSQTHYISSDDLSDSTTITWFFYDKNKTYISRFVSCKNRRIALSGDGIVIPSNASFYRLAVKTTDVNVRVQVEKGTYATEYEPYYGSEYTTTNRKLAIKSSCPYMTLIADSDVDIVMNYNKSYGMQVEHDRFWDTFQANGTRNAYQYAFMYWDCEYIRPKYKVAPTDGRCIQLFYGNKKLKKVEAEYFDFSQVPIPTYASIGNYYTFQFCSSLEEIEDIGLLGYFYSGTFHGCEKLHTIAVLRSYESTTFSANPFYGCSSLQNITIEGVIGQNGFDIHWGTLLSGESIVSIIEALSATTSGLTITLSQTAVSNMSFPITSTQTNTVYNSWDELIATKSNWTVSLV